MNKTMKAVAATALTVMTLMATSGAEAALVERLGGKAIYDDVANLTWLQDANYAQTSGYDDDGRGLGRRHDLGRGSKHRRCDGLASADRTSD
jgi:hypothetical protein